MSDNEAESKPCTSPDQFDAVPTIENLTDMWIRFFMEYDFVRRYDIAYALEIVGDDIKPPALSILDDIVRTLFYIRLVSMLSSFLSYHIRQNNPQLNPRHYDTLDKKIQKVADCVDPTLACQIGKIRHRRNEISHEESHITKDEFDAAVIIVTIVLKKLSLVSEKPRCEAYGRSESHDPEKPGVLCRRVYRYGVKSEGHDVLEATWSVDFIRNRDRTTAK